MQNGDCVYGNNWFSLHPGSLGHSWYSCKQLYMIEFQDQWKLPEVLGTVLDVSIILLLVNRYHSWCTQLG